jgi:fibronectin-binding autotransporter adhesin
MSFTTGGVAKLTDTSVSTQGAQMDGVLTSTGGATTILGGSISTAGTQAFGVVAVNGGTTTIANSLVGPTTITTTGASANAIDAAQGGSVQVSGAQITTSLDGSMGLVVTGSSSTLTASGVSVTTKGGIDTTTGYYANGAYNGPGGSDLTGGTLSLTDSTIVVSGAQVFGVFTGTGGTTTISGGLVTTSGVGSSGVGTYGGGSTALSNGSVTTSGQDAHALVVNGSGSQASLSGSNTFATQGAGAIGFYATAGGGVTATGPVTITTTGGVSPATGLGAFGVNADGAGSQIKLASASITTSGVGATGLFASDASSSGAAGSITVSGTLNIQTKNAAAAAVALQGAGASIFATGGGTIASAGDAIDFLGGKNQVATFDNFTIANTTGNLIFADPSVSTVNFNSTTANAGLNNLLDATNGSAITLNANASALTGAIQTDSTSTTAVNLTNGSVWTMTGSSAVSNLAVTNSAILFAPPGSSAAFKTLTVGSYVGTGANLTMNTALGGTGSASDQLAINGGSATGSTLLTIHNVGGAGAQTTGNGIPVVVVSNGGTTASNAFALANTPVVGGFRYSLEDTNDDWYLVSSPTSTQSDIANSVNNVAKSQQQLITTNRILDSILLGATEQVNCSNCSSGFGSVGSYALGAHGRHSLTDELTVIGGFSYGEYSADGVTVSNAPSIAGSLIYDFVNWGRSRPFVEVGGGATPFEDVKYSRSYANGATTGTGYGEAVNRNLGIFGRVGWVDRLTPIDEAAVYGDISRSWMIAGGYTEGAGPGNPYPATVQTGLDTLNVARVGGQYTHLFNGNIEVNVSAAVAYGFGAGSGNQFSVVDFGTIAPYPIANSYWLEYGGRVGYRLPNKMVLDAFLLGTAFGEIGKTLHGGVGLRLFF